MPPASASVPSMPTLPPAPALAMFGCVEWTSHPGKAMSRPARGWW